MAQCGRLTVFMHSRPVAEFRLEDRHRYLVGRADNADCRIDDPDVSRHHLEIDTTTRPWQLKDLGSKNGTRLEGRPLDTAVLTQSHWLTLSGIPARIELLDAASDQAWREWTETRRTAARRSEQALDPGQDPSVLLKNVLTAFVELAECTHGALFLADEHGRPVPVYCHGSDQFEGSASVPGKVMHTGEAVVNSDIRTQQAHAGQQSIVGGGLRAMACLPLILAGQVRGALYADSRQPGKIFTQLDLELLDGLARQAVFIIAVSRLSHDVERLQMQLPASPDALESSQHLAQLLDQVMPAASGSESAG